MRSYNNGMRTNEIRLSRIIFFALNCFVNFIKKRKKTNCGGSKQYILHNNILNCINKKIMKCPKPISYI